MPKFSVCVIAKNEEKTLPRLLGSLEEFKKRGGEVCILDTGSTDNTAKIARDWGCKVEEVGDKFVFTIDKKLSDEINNRFVLDGEELVTIPGDKFFNFAEARNHCASMASNDIISMPDADEAYTSLDIDYIDEQIALGYEQFEFNFVFAHDQFGEEAIKFVQCKMYDRRVLKWTGVIHEHLQGSAKKMFLPEDKFKIEHWQNEQSQRKSYLKGLSYACFSEPENDRNSHYLARELFWCGRPKSALKEFERHVAMRRWNSELAESYIFMGDIYGILGSPQKQAECYERAIYEDGHRRKPYLKLAHFYRHNNDPVKTAAYAKASMEIGWNGFYAEDMSMYRQEPHELLYWAYGWMGNIAEAQKHILKALEYQPYNLKILDETKFYFEYHSPIEGWMKFEELQFLYNNAKKFNSICEVGSWKGRSTHAICSGCKGKVVAIDHFEGSKFEPDAHAQAKDGSVYKEFLENMKDCKNLVVNKTDSKTASGQYQEGEFDMVFIDAGHTYEEVLEDIALWRNKARFLLCGHDYDEKIWPGVKKAVDESIVIDGVAGTIWYKFMNLPKVSVVIPTLGRPEKLNNCLEAIKKFTYPNYEVIVEHDSFENRQGAIKTLNKGVDKSSGELVMFLGNDCVPEPECLMNAVRCMYNHFGPEMDGLVGLNDGYWQGEFATHWLASKKLLPYLDGTFFHDGYHHTGCDNELTERCRLIDKYRWEKDARLFHDHPINTGFKQDELDEVYKLAYDKQKLKEDQSLLIERGKKFGFEIDFSKYKPMGNKKIPKIIWTIWLGKMPELIKNCIEKQKIEGYEHRLITLENCWRGSQYVIDAIESENYVKAADFLRAYYLYSEGGIYLDADTEILEGKNFDDLLDNKMFVCKEDNGFISNGIIGSVSEHPILSDFLNYVEKNFKGNDTKIFEAGMEVFTDLVYHADSKWGVKVLPMEYFLPFNHQTGITNITENTRTFHHYLKSWK